MNNINKKALLSGNDAVGQGAYEAGLKVASAYPGTPSTEILQYIAQFEEIDSQWAVNEKVAFEVAYGASIGGARSIYVSKHVGLNVAMDGVMTSAYMGVNAGFVIVVCDDPGLHSSQNEQDTRMFAKVAKIPLLEPSTPTEAKKFIKIAFEMSEAQDIPVIIRMVTRISHTKEDVVIHKRVEAPNKPFERNMAKYVMVPACAYKRHIDLENNRLPKLKEFAEKTELNREEINNIELGFITSSTSYLYTKEVFPNASYLKLGMSYPFPAEKVKAFASKVKNLIIIEELEPFIEENVQLLGIEFKTKHKSFRVGELDPDEILNIVEGKEKVEKTAPKRKPMLCNGCSHRLVYSVLKKLDLTVTGDIGCYTLGALPPFSSVHTCLCMGSGITFAEGFFRAGVPNTLGVIGDSTFIHSGITGLISAAYNNTKGTIIILDNSTTAMTGGQPHPATGNTIKMQPTKPLDLEKICIASGADTVDVIDPKKVKELEALVKQRMSEDNLSVIIAQMPCVLLKSKEVKK